MRVLVLGLRWRGRHKRFKTRFKRHDVGQQHRLVLHITTDCVDHGTICTQDGRMLYNHNEITVSGPGG